MGATDHISSHFQSFTSFQSIKLVPVSLLNGNTIFASVSGTVQLTPTLVLYNVLYIHDFSVNLVFVAKLSVPIIVTFNLLIVCVTLCRTLPRRRLVQLVLQEDCM